MDVLYLPSFLWASALLAAASAMDLRSREVSDRVWWAMLPAMVPVLLSQGSVSLGTLLASASSAVLFALFMGGEGRTAYILALSAVALWVPAALCGGSLPYLLSPLFQVLFYLAYLAGLVPGGADAKCLMAVAAVFPVYPDGTGMLCTALPPAVSVLFVGTVSTAVGYGLWLILENRKRGRSAFPYLRVPLEEARSSFAWILEDYRGGKVVRCADGGAEALDRLEGAGAGDVLVSPMIPFIVPMAFGFLATMAFGCPFTWSL